MASIQEPDVVDRFRAAMEKIQTKLQVRTAELTEAVLEQGRAHKQLLGSAVGESHTLLIGFYLVVGLDKKKRSN